MENTIIYLIGFPGTGKYTVAKEICKQADVKLVDNHLINNPVFAFVERDGVTPLPDEVWKLAHKIRETVLETITTLSPLHYNFVFTNVLVDNDWVDQAIYDLIKQTAAERKAKFVPIRLECEVEENLKRIASPERKAHMKQMKPESAREIRAEKSIISIEHANILDLDITEISAEKAAGIILKHANNC